MLADAANLPARFEAGGTVPTLAVLGRIAKALDASLAVRVEARSNAISIIIEIVRKQVGGSASPCIPGAGWSSASSPGSAAIAVWRKSSRPPSPRPLPSSMPHPCCCSRGGWLVRFGISGIGTLSALVARGGIAVPDAIEGLASLIAKSLYQRTSVVISRILGCWTRRARTPCRSSSRPAACGISSSAHAEYHRDLLQRQKPNGKGGQPILVVRLSAQDRRRPRCLGMGIFCWRGHLDRRGAHCRCAAVVAAPVVDG